MTPEVGSLLVSRLVRPLLTASLATALYPPAPNLISDPPEDPEWHIFYAVRTGIRYTGMPAWEKTLSQQDIWKVTALLSHLNKLPPTVQEYWKTTFGVTSPSGEEKEGEGMKHDKH